VVVGEAYGYFYPWTPDLTPAPSFPADTVALFEEWDAPWLKIGATEEGWSIGGDMDIQDHNIEEQSTLVAQTVNSSNFGAEASLAEDTLQSMSLAWNLAPLVVTAPATGQPGKTTTTLTDTINYYVFGFEMRNHYGMARRFLIPKVSVHGSDRTAHRRSDSKRLYPLTVSSLCAPSEIQVVEFTAPATA
jgi:hypothetical protein